MTQPAVDGTSRTRTRTRTRASARTRETTACSHDPDKQPRGGTNGRAIQVPFRPINNTVLPLLLRPRSPSRRLPNRAKPCPTELSSAISCDKKTPRPSVPARRPTRRSTRGESFLLPFSFFLVFSPPYLFSPPPLRDSRQCSPAGPLILCQADRGERRGRTGLVCLLYEGVPEQTPPSPL